MSTRLASVVIEAADPAVTARFWYIMLGGTAAPERDGGHRLVAPEVGGCGIDLVFVPAQGTKIVKNRIHVDLATESAHEYQVLTTLAADLGARPVNVGQGPGVPWTVFKDPEGNEFCVLEPRDLYDRTGPLAALVVDSADPAGMAAFWGAATGWPQQHVDEHSAALRTAETSGPWIEFLRVDDPKRGTNRIRFDIAPIDSDGDDAVNWLLAMGARRRPDGPGPAALLTDPEGNEFRVLPAHVRT
ncbi:VOC family protein [Actinokineospora sp.]|uniref:VOC family protein n=1 Tax=Actinokineospora sp. TaxID=1872133 RepID=UPI00403806D9